MKKVAPGTKMGINDGAPPETNSNWNLSRIHDILVNADAVLGVEARKRIWDVLPYTSKFEYNWTSWVYVGD